MTKLSDDELNKRVHEIMGLCFHQGGSKRIIAGTWWYYCVNCRHEFPGEEPNNYKFITTWQGFGLMWEFMQKHERWEEFLWEQDGDNCCLPVRLISPRPFAEAMCNFFKEENKPCT